MKHIIEIDGRTKWSGKIVKEQFGISGRTLSRWRDRNLLPAPIKLGNVTYYDRDAVIQRVRKGE